VKKEETETFDPGHRTIITTLLLDSITLSHPLIVVPIVQANQAIQGLFPSSTLPDDDQTPHHPSIQRVREKEREDSNICLSRTYHRKKKRDTSGLFDY